MGIRRSSSSSSRPAPTPPSNHNGQTPLDQARFYNRAQCIALLEAAMAEPQRARSLLKARALIDAALAIPKAADDAQAKGRSRAAQQRAMLAAAPAYLKGRVREGEELPDVVVLEEEEEESENEELLLACLKYVLGLEGGGGWHEGEGPAPRQGMLKELFVELCEMLVAKWDRANV
jgi:hypothetical protein